MIFWNLSSFHAPCSIIYQTWELFFPTLAILSSGISFCLSTQIPSSSEAKPHSRASEGTRHLSEQMRPDRGDWWRLQCCPFSHRLAAPVQHAQSPPRCSSRFLLLSLPPHSADTIAAADSYWGLARSQRLCHVFLNWNIVVLQCCVSFSCLAKWISCVHIYSSPFFGFLSYLGHHRALSPFP